MANQRKFALTSTANIISVFSANPQLNFTSDQLDALAAGTLVLVGPGLTPSGARLKLFGCIKTLRFQKSDTDLQYVQFDSGDYLDLGNAANLNDFRQTFKNAADFGHGVSACHDTVNNKIFMVNLIPCQCTCEKRDQPIIT